jgi:hypothetical protein
MILSFNEAFPAKKKVKGKKTALGATGRGKLVFFKI